MTAKKFAIITALIITAVSIVYILYLGWENRDTTKLSNHEICELVAKARHDDVNAIAKLSSHYESVGDKSNAIYWLQISANKGDSVSAYHLYYLLSEGTTRDITKALAYLKKSAQSGYPVAQWKLSQLYAEGVLVSEDENKAKYWLDKSKQSQEVK